jgi:uncharacterized protein (UPF0276 family)
MIGVGYRRELASWIDLHLSEIECLEITAEHFFHTGRERLAELRRTCQLFVHGLGLSLGTPGPIDPSRLKAFAEVAAASHAEWISEHVSFTRTDEVDLGHLNPVQPTKAMVQVIADHAREVSDYCQRPIILENITSHLRLAGDLSETEFLNAICDRANCGLLLDVTNLFINSRNHRFDPLAWLGELDVSRIVQLHLVGYSVENGRYLDSHAQPIQTEILDLAGEIVSQAPVRAVILERDSDFTDHEALNRELSKLTDLLARH